jgi:hypothetical protein
MVFNASNFSNTTAIIPGSGTAYFFYTCNFNSDPTLFIYRSFLSYRLYSRWKTDFFLNILKKKKRATKSLLLWECKSQENWFIYAFFFYYYSFSPLFFFAFLLFLLLSIHCYYYYLLIIYIHIFVFNKKKKTSTQRKTKQHNLELFKWRSLPYSVVFFSCSNGNLICFTTNCSIEKWSRPLV